MLKHNPAITIAALTALLSGPFFAPMALSAGSAASPQQAIDKEISLLENRFFSRQYLNDPIEKRVERLELLFFGAIQDGDVQQRCARLKKAIADRAAVRTGAATATGGSAGKNAGRSSASSSSQYPILNTLEWRAFKKTYPNETLDARLSRLEKKSFGADSPAMAYADRVDRLKRTLGLGITAQQPPPGIKLGPAPKARPYGQSPSNSFSYSWPQVFGNGDGDDDDFFSDGGGSGMGMPPGLGIGVPSNLSNMMRQMQRQMSQLEQMPSGNWIYDQKSGAWIEQNTGRRFKPGQPDQNKEDSPDFNSPPLVPRSTPFKLTPHNDNELPPYSDPNTI